MHHSNVKDFVNTPELSGLWPEWTSTWALPLDTTLFGIALLTPTTFLGSLRYGAWIRLMLPLPGPKIPAYSHRFRYLLDRPSVLDDRPTCRRHVVITMKLQNSHAHLKPYKFLFGQTAGEDGLIWDLRSPLQWMGALFSEFSDKRCCLVECGDSLKDHYSIISRMVEFFSLSFASYLPVAPARKGGMGRGGACSPIDFRKSSDILIFLNGPSRWRIIHRSLLEVWWGMFLTLWRFYFNHFIFSKVVLKLSKSSQILRKVPKVLHFAKLCLLSIQSQTYTCIIHP